MLNKEPKINHQKKLRVLLLDQGRQSLPFLKSLSQAGHEVIIVCNTRICEGYFSRYPVKRLIWPSYFKNPQGFEIELINYLKSEDIDVTISVGDISSEILSRNKNEITSYTSVTVPDYPLFQKVTDKLQLMQYCMTNDIPCPKTYDLNDIYVPDIINDIEFPVIVKPRRGIGAIGLNRFNNSDDLVNNYKALTEKYGPLLVQEYIPQEDGMQYQAEAFLDENSKMKVCMVIEKPRFFPVKGGTSTANVTIEHQEINKITQDLLEGVRWKGAADVDFILDPRNNRPKVLEINPRVTAGIKIGFAAGIDYADMHIKLALGEPIQEINQYKLGIYSRNIFMDLLWYLFSTKQMRKKTKPSFYRFFGKNIVEQTFSLDDPLTGLGFFLNMSRKYLNVSTFKEKLGR